MIYILIATTDFIEHSILQTTLQLKVHINIRLEKCYNIYIHCILKLKGKVYLFFCTYLRNLVLHQNKIKRLK